MGIVVLVEKGAGCDHVLPPKDHIRRALHSNAHAVGTTVYLRWKINDFGAEIVVHTTSRTNTVKVADAWTPIAPRSYSAPRVRRQRR